MDSLSSRQKGFTLIELLVVVAIIALLVAILVPALSNARELAKSVVCRSNLSQCALALHMYANDYNGWLPYFDAYAINPFGPPLAMCRGWTE